MTRSTFIRSNFLTLLTLLDYLCYELTLKEGAVAILLRNLDQEHGHTPAILFACSERNINDTELHHDSEEQTINSGNRNVTPSLHIPQQARLQLGPRLDSVRRHSFI